MSYLVIQQLTLSLILLFLILNYIDKKRNKDTSETESKKLKIQSLFKKDQFPDKYYQVYDENDNFIGYIVDDIKNK